MGYSDRHLTGFLSPEDEERAFTLQYIDVLRQALEDTRPVLVVIDPLQAYLGEIDMHRVDLATSLCTHLGTCSSTPSFFRS